MQRQHYKTDWHRYNLKRKFLELPPVTKEDFGVRVRKHEAEVKAMANKHKEPTGYCVCCSKAFTTQKAYGNHLNSKKHKQEEVKFNLKANKDEIANNRMNRKPSQCESEDDDDDMEVEEVDSDEWDELDDEEAKAVPIGDCLFCDNHFKDLEKSLLHMMEKHSFFLQDAEFLVDAEGLMTYLGEKVGRGLMCLWCNVRSRSFTSLDAVRKHMKDKGHCKLNHESVEFVEYAKFYDFSSTYPEGVEENEEDGVELDRLDDSGFEMVLPSGAKVGHRSLLRYYRQSLNPDRQIATRQSMNRVVHHYKALGWSGSTPAELKKKAKDEKFMRHAKQRHWMQLGVKANRLQRHFVDPTL